ncbi:MAG: hypothetical protein AAGH15_04785 [Myxococcota bacterium]
MKRALLAFAFVALGASGAAAQGPDPFAQPQPEQQPPPPPPGQPVVVQQQPYQAPPPQQQPAARRGARQASLFIPITFFVTNADIFTGGAGIGARFGWEFQNFIPQLEAGVHVNGVEGTFGDVTLQNTWFGLGLRFQFLNASRFVPFIEGMVRFNLWSINVLGTEIDNELQFGVHGGGGVTIELTRFFSIDLQVNLHASFDNAGVFSSIPGSNETQLILEPRIGGTVYF